jgi:hypothetical protein
MLIGTSTMANRKLLLFAQVGERNRYLLIVSFIFSHSSTGLGNVKLLDKKGATVAQRKSERKSMERLKDAQFAPQTWKIFKSYWMNCRAILFLVGNAIPKLILVGFSGYDL